MLVAAFTQQAPLIQVPVRLVEVPTLVFSRAGTLISGLQRADFRVADNGRARHFQLEENTSARSVALVIQTSQTVRSYLPFLAKTGNTFDTFLLGETPPSSLTEITSGFYNNSWLAIYTPPWPRFRPEANTLAW